MPMSAVPRASGIGPQVDPGEAGWAAMGLGVYPGPGLSLIGNYPAAERERILHSQDAYAFGPATPMVGPGPDPGAYTGTGPLSEAQNRRMMAAMNEWQLAAWTGQGDPGNYIRVGNTLQGRDNTIAPGPIGVELSREDFWRNAPGGSRYLPPGTDMSALGTTRAGTSYLAGAGNPQTYGVVPQFGQPGAGEGAPGSPTLSGTGAATSHPGTITNLTDLGGGTMLPGVPGSPGASRMMAWQNPAINPAIRPQARYLSPARQAYLAHQAATRARKL